MPPSSLNHISACSFSLAAVCSNMRAICTYPSFFALEAKYVYLLRACDSPANASRRFCSVRVPLSFFISFVYGSYKFYYLFVKDIALFPLRHKFSIVYFYPAISKYYNTDPHKDKSCFCGRHVISLHL